MVYFPGVNQPTYATVCLTCLSTAAMDKDNREPSTGMMLMSFWLVSYFKYVV